MTRFFKRNRTIRLRAVRAYLVVILVCTFLLFSFSIVALNEQREKLTELSSRNLELIGEQAASEVEGLIALQARNCLSSQTIRNLSLDSANQQSLKKAKTLRDQFRALQQKYPVAEHFFVFVGDQLVYPQISVQNAQTFGNEGSSQFSRLMRDAEDKEMRWDAPSEAVGLYRRAMQIADSPELKAFACFRMARSLWNSNEREAGIENYRKLIDSYGDQYDESQVPYILALAAGPEEIADRLFVSGTQSLASVYKQLCEGRWELSAEQTNSYLARLEQRLQLSAEDRPSTAFLNGFQFAKAVNLDKEIKDPVKFLPLAEKAIESGNRHYLTFRTVAPGENGHNFIVGFSASTAWIEELLLSSQPLKGRDIGFVRLIEAGNSGKSISDNDVEVPFKNFWKIRIPEHETRLNELAASREVWFLGLTALMFLAILGLSLVLLMRVTWEIRWFHLRSEFVSGVSHEFKTPLSLIRLYSETLATDDQTFSPEDRRNYVRIIVRESARMSRLIDNVLDFSKIEQGRRSYELKEGDLGGAVSQTVQDYSEYLTYQGFSIKSSIWPTLPLVRFNAEQVSQMMLNLLDNARKYSGESRLIRVNIWVQGPEVVVEVQDKGYGIPAEEQEKIFKPFYRSSKGGEQGGCGLGLYLVDQVMKEHGGRIEVESEVNQGSRFRLFFPVCDVEKSKASKKIGEQPAKADSNQRVQSS